MKHIVHTRSGYHVERKSRGGLAFGALILGVVALVAAVPLWAGGAEGAAVFFVLLLGVPSVVLADRAGRERWKVAAVIEARQVAGGVLLKVMDARQVPHELVVDEDTAQGLASALTGRTGIER